MHLERSSGILMPVFSLPSNYGIGTFGKAAFDFIDFLYAANQKYWQILPLGPISYGDSPYQSFSTYAGNPYFIDLDILIQEELLLEEEVSSITWNKTQDKIDYETLFNYRFDVLRKAYKRGMKKDLDDFYRFVESKKQWIEEYALFMACKKHFGMKAWIEWEDKSIRLHEQEACEKYKELLKEDVEFYEYLQYLFFKQWNALKTYANEKGIEIIGDLPIYVAYDSSDVWSNPYWFYLDEENKPIEVSGCPPDAFSVTGQLWGNPLYRYDRMQEDGFGWWIRRVGGAFDLYDVLRIDHFRGLESYWSIPFGEKTAIHGQWVKAPGMNLVGVLTSWFHDKKFIAEDLGYLTPEVRQLLLDSKLPGMKVLEFAFDSREPSNHLPHTYTENSICYVGTHDNTTLAGWLDEADIHDIAYAKEYLGIDDDLVWGFIRAGMRSVSNVFIAQMQDYLELKKEARINTPGTASGNWVWRMKEGALTKTLADKINKMTVMYGRNLYYDNKEM